MNEYSRFQDLLKKIVIELKGQPGIQLFDGEFYKIISVKDADLLVELIELIEAKE